MNRQWTGWLAWSALAIFIAVPSAEVVLSKSEPSATESSAREELNVAVVEEPAAKTPFFGPMPAKPSGGADPFALPQSQKEEPVRAAEIPAEEPAIDMEPVTEPAAPRIVGDERMVMAKTPETTLPVVEDINIEDDVVTASVDTEAQTSLGDPIPLEFRIGSGVIEGRTELASLETEVETDTQLAPIPMPASLRPAAPKTAAVASVDFNDEVRASIDNVRASRRDDFLYEDNYIEDDFVEPEFFGGDDRLIPFERGEFYEEEYVGDNGFYEIWREERRPPGFRRRGSFEEQLPARRGSGIRMDLLQ